MKESYEQPNPTQGGQLSLHEISLVSVLEYRPNKKQQGYCLDSTSHNGTYQQIVEIECVKQFKIVMRMASPYKTKAFAICSSLE